MCTNFLLQTAICVTYRQFVQKLDHPRLVFLDKWVYHFHKRLLQRDQVYVLAYQLPHSERLSSFLQMQFIKWSRISFDLTLIPNSTKFAKFCNAFAISFKVRQATSDGVSGRHGKKTYKCTCLYLKKNILQRNEIQTTNRILKETIPVIKLKDFGFRIAGHNSLRKMKPLKPKKTTTDH